MAPMSKPGMQEAPSPASACCADCRSSILNYIFAACQTVHLESLLRKISSIKLSWEILALLYPIA
jgi:hypothetical protein